jgi:hypothetical protein
MFDARIKSYIDRANAVHDNKYDYSRWVCYDGGYHKRNIPVVCNAHGLFHTSVANHLRGAGCPKCGELLKAAKKRISVTEYKKRAEEVHGDTYDYSLWKPVNNASSDKVEIICKHHGIFEQTPTDHISKKSGCPECAKRTRVLNTDYINRIQPPRYNANILDNITDRSWLVNQHHVLAKPLTQISSELGINDGVLGKYCKAADVKVIRHPASAGEKELNNFINTMVPTVTGDRVVLNGHELDILIPSHNIAIEYCGLYWHSEQKGKDRNYHKNKLLLAADKNIQLFTVYEDEWKLREEAVRRKLTNALGFDQSQVVYARQCEIRDVTQTEKKQFFEKNHIQGNGPGSISVGLYYTGELVACMTLIHQQRQHYLNRYATSTRVVGGFSKLVKHFQRTHEWSKIISFADCRWSTGSLYDINGWELEATIPPDYYYSKDGHTRTHKFNYRHKNLPNMLTNYDPMLTETENCNNNNILRIWDCGKKKFVLTNHNS